MDDNSNKNLKDDKELERMRHSFAHVLAQAVLRLIPTAKLGIGPAVENGFYYEFDLPEEIDEKFLKKIEKEMKKIIEEELPFTQIIIKRQEAFDLLHQQGQIYKAELLQRIPDEEISFYKTGEEFIDLCRGPHVKHTGQLKAFKLISIEQTHWDKNPNRPIMYRINGVAFKTQEELQKYLDWEKQRLQKEHRVLGPQRNYFYFSKNIGPGLPLWLEEGIIVKNIIKNYLRKERKEQGYIEVSTPTIAKVSLFKETGHFEFYQERDFNPFKINGKLYMLRPMVTPTHIEVFRSKRHGYQTMPYKIFEFAKVYRDEDSKKLNGLSRTREFTQDSSHIFTTPQEAIEEVAKILISTIRQLNFLGFKDYRLHFSRKDNKHPENYLGNNESWEKAEHILIKALEINKLVAREDKGEAEFYGPKIDFIIKDILNQDWQIATIQMDLITPKRCNLIYIDENNKKKTPYIIHHSTIGSLERFFAILIEHYKGILPLWLAPTQAIILPISANYINYAQKVYKKLKDLNIRVKIDQRNKTLQNKIRHAQLLEIPYMLIVGKQEEASEVISLRSRKGDDIGIMTVEEFYENFKLELNNK